MLIVIYCIVVFLLLLSSSLNIHLYLKFKKARHKPQPTIEAQDMLQNIMTGGAILDIKVIDPGTIYFHRG